MSRDEWELYSVFIPSNMKYIVEYIKKQRNENRLEIDDAIALYNKEPPCNGYRYIVMENKYDNEIIVLWSSISLCA